MLEASTKKLQKQMEDLEVSMHSRVTCDSMQSCILLFTSAPDCYILSYSKVYYQEYNINTLYFSYVYIHDVVCAIFTCDSYTLDTEL